MAMSLYPITPVLRAPGSSQPSGVEDAVSNHVVDAEDRVRPVVTVPQAVE